MTKQKSTKRALLLSALSLLMCVSMLIGSTFAWFTDSVTSGRNIIQSGNLDAKLSFSTWDEATNTWGDYQEVTSDTIVFGKDAKYEPGYTEVVKFKVENLGSLAFKYQLGMHVFKETPSINVDGDEFYLSDYIKVGTMDAEVDGWSVDRASAAEYATMNIKDAKNLALVPNPFGGYFANLPLEPAGSISNGVRQDVDEWAFVIHMPTTVGNEANHKSDVEAPSIEFAVNLLATQYTYENDSFDNKYDIGATYPAAASFALPENRTEPTAIKAGDVTVEIPVDAPAGNYKLTVDNTSVDVDEDGNSVANFEINLTRDGKSVNSDGKEYTVTIFVAKGLNPDTTKLYHKGVDITSSIISASPVDGTVTFKTDSFSPFAVAYKVDCDIFVEQNEQTKIKTIYVFTADGFEQLNKMMADKTAGKYAVVKLCANIDMTGKTWTPVDSHADTAFYLSEFDGQGFTISNLTINGQAMFTRFAGVGDVTVKDVTFYNATVNSSALNTSILTVQTYQNLLLDNVDVKSSSITGTYKVAPLVATVYDEKESSIVCTVKNCDVSDTVVTSTVYDFFTCGMISFVYTTNNDYVEYENCSITNVQLRAVSGGYNYHANIHYTSADTDDQINEHPEVKVTNVTFESLG